MSEENKTVELSKTAQEILDKVEKLSLLEAAELVSAMEEKFGVSAAAPTAVAAAPADAAPAEEKTEFNVELASFGDSKISVIKVVKDVCALGLKEAKDLVETAPCVLKETVAKEEAETMKSKLEEAGATVNLK
ncbi:50S ribosomal protein L7/L12 [Patescibacteria group bacterium]|nr:50S ribosomal protein L7/L12 [Patescibacteria group bacterium]